MPAALLYFKIFLKKILKRIDNAIEVM